MLLPPILRASSQSDDYIASLKSDCWKLAKLSEINTYKFGGELSEKEQSILVFVERVYQLSYSIKLVSDNPTAALPLWRSLYETVVLFKVLTQSVNLTGRLESFNQCLERFKDLDTLKYYQFGQKPLEVLQLEKKYREMPKHLQLTLEYDWLNPNFDQKTLSRMNKKNHPSFRDLISRTRESGVELYKEIPFYERASEVLHFNYSSSRKSAETTKDEIEQKTLSIIREFLSDYLSLLVNLYSNDRENNDALNSILSAAEYTKIKVLEIF